jgi:mono/diheme cytochrome c family protein
MGSRSSFPAAARLLAVALALGGLISCGGGKPDPADLDDAAAADPSLLSARSQYRFHCGACHGKDGRGRANLFPPLRGSSWVNGDPVVPIHVVLHGVDGAITVEGEKYLNLMPPLGHRLEDEQIARILTYVRASWGNTARAVVPAEVAAVRAATTGRTKPMTEPELTALGAASPSP